jgi:hypothetical protein
MYARSFDAVVADLIKQLRRDPEIGDKSVLMSFWDVERFSYMIDEVSDSEWDDFVDWVGNQPIPSENDFMQDHWDKYKEYRAKQHDQEQ